jgi:S-adenosylmethionine:tRNA-ribosyltransferase-isomerase (queuine synthetase)
MSTRGRKPKLVQLELFEDLDSFNESYINSLKSEIKNYKDINLRLLLAIETYKLVVKNNIQNVVTHEKICEISNDLAKLVVWRNLSL